jgi:hypothetical protein
MHVFQLILAYKIKHNKIINNVKQLHNKVNKPNIGAGDSFTAYIHGATKGK